MQTILNPSFKLTQMSHPGVFLPIIDDTKCIGNWYFIVVTKFVTEQSTGHARSLLSQSFIQNSQVTEISVCKGSSIKK